MSTSPVLLFFFRGAKLLLQKLDYSIGIFFRKYFGLPVGLWNIFQDDWRARKSYLLKPSFHLINKLRYENIVMWLEGS